MRLYNDGNKQWGIVDLNAVYGGTRFSALAHNLEIINQRGQTCGLHALATILRANGVDVKATRNAVSVGNNAGPSLRKLAKERNSVAANRRISQIGELFNARDVAPLVEAIPSAINVAHREIAGEDEFIDILKEAIDLNKLIMVPFCVADNGLPLANDGAAIPAGNGENAHWCIVLGYNESNDDVTEFLTAHWGALYFFNAHTFAKSNANIHNFPASSWCKRKVAASNNINYDKCTQPACGNLAAGPFEDFCAIEKVEVSCVRIEDADLSNTLAKQFVVIG